jgi:glycosyltransferase involved in cell wall biosynthesis
MGAIRRAAGTGGRGGLLVVLEGDLGGPRGGPEIRGWEIARALAPRMRVSVAVRRPDLVQERELAAPGGSIRVVSRRRLGLFREAAAHDAALAPWIPAYLLAGAGRCRTLTVADLYDPIDIESASLADDSDRQFLETARHARRMQLRFADVLLCANARQREAIQSELAALPDLRQRPDVLLVPFGVGADPPAASRGLLRRAFPTIAEDDTVVLWWGGIWRWLDAQTAIRAAARAEERHPGLRLIFATGGPPAKRVRRLDATEEARTLAESLGLRDRVVFFIDEWVPYEDRHEYLLEADVGLTLHREPQEAKLSARARSMDYLWARLPCVLSDGTELGQVFARAGFASEVPIGDVEAATAALLKLVEDAAARRRARAAAEALVPAYRWGVVTEPLADLLIGTGGATPSRGGGLAGVSGAVAYYAQRARQESARFMPGGPRGLSDRG